MEEEPSLEGPWWYLASALRQCLGTLGGAIAVFVLGSDRVAALTGVLPTARNALSAIVVAAAFVGASAALHFLLPLFTALYSFGRLCWVAGSGCWAAAVFLFRWGRSQPQPICLYGPAARRMPTSQFFRDIKVTRQGAYPRVVVRGPSGGARVPEPEW